MRIVMNSYDDISKRIGKYMGYTILFITSLIIIGIVAGITWYSLTEYSYKYCDKQFINGCMSAGLSEEVCEDRVY